MPDNARCENCMYWLYKSVNPVCRRYPLYQIHGPGDWCGEYKASKENAKPKRKR